MKGIELAVFAFFGLFHRQIVSKMVAKLTLAKQFERTECSSCLNGNINEHTDRISTPRQTRWRERDA